MKQVWYEWKKLISDKSVLLVVVLSMCIVLGYQWKNADSYAWQRNESYRECYEAALTTVGNGLGDSQTMATGGECMAKLSALGSIWRFRYGIRAVTDECTRG